MPPRATFDLVGFFTPSLARALLLIIAACIGVTLPAAWERPTSCSAFCACTASSMGKLRPGPAKLFFGSALRALVVSRAISSSLKIVAEAILVAGLVDNGARRATALMDMMSHGALGLVMPLHGLGLFHMNHDRFFDGPVARKARVGHKDHCARCARQQQDPDRTAHTTYPTAPGTGTNTTPRPST